MKFRIAIPYCAISASPWRLTTLDWLDIHHYVRLLKNAMAVLDSIPKSINECLRSTQDEGLSAPREARYIAVLRKLSERLKFARWPGNLRQDEAARLPSSPG